MFRPLVSSLAAAALCASTAEAQQFIYNSAALPAQTLWTDGVELVDVDADGDVDLVFANGSAYGSTGTAGALDQHLFLNDGTGSFTAAHAQLNHGGNFNAKQVIAEDFDNDGDPDLAYCTGSAGHAPRLLLNDGSGNFTIAAGAFPTTPTLRSFGICAGDIDDDGDLDIAISDGGTFGGLQAQQRLWTNDGSGVFTDVTATQMPVDLYNCQDITFVDFDGDFDVDMLLTGKGAAGKRGRLYTNDGNGNFTIDSAMDQVGTGNTYEGEWSDLDGDGDFDCSVQSINSVNEGWARNDGLGVAMPESVYPAPNGGDDNEMAQMDYDNDGDSDAFAGSLASSGEKLWRNNGNATFTNQNGLIQTITDSTLDMGFADLDGDGDYDMVTAQGESGNFTNKVYRNTGARDTLPPDVMAIDNPGVIGASGTVFHLQYQDSISDDGKVGISVVATYVSNTGSGSATTSRMGGGLWRVSVPSTGATDSLVVTVTATDGVGNDTVTSLTLGAASPWTDLGNGLAGTGGNVPVLTGSGPLTAGSANSVDLSNALAGSTTNIVLGLSTLNAPFKGGVLVPSTDALFLGLPVSGAGTNSVPFVWPNGIPAGAKVYLQHWVSDAGGPVGFAASNGLEGEAQ